MLTSSMGFAREAGEHEQWVSIFENIISREEKLVNAINSIDLLAIYIGDIPRTYHSTLLTCRLLEK
jgi:hypothetical protein